MPTHILNVGISSRIITRTSHCQWYLATNAQRGPLSQPTIPRQPHPHPHQFPLLYAKSNAFFEFAVFYYGVCVFFLAVLGPPHLQRTHHVTPKGREALHSWTGLDWLVRCRLCILHHQLLLDKHIPWGTSTSSHDVSERWIRWRGLSRSVCHTIVTLQSIYNQSIVYTCCGWRR